MATHLLEPIMIRNMRLNNRLAMPPMATGKALPDGHVSPEMLAYYKEKSAGGYIGLVIIEHGYASPEGKASERQLSVADDSAIAGLRKLAGIIHGQGSKAVMQINHAGSATSKDIIGTVPVAPSVVSNPVKNSVPRELTKEEIGGIVRAFASAAGRVKEAGYDGVEIHSIYCYLLNQFFSPITNKRNDEYGGDVKNRVRIHLEIIKAVRETVGQDYPVFLRLSATDGREGGTTIEDCMVAAKALEDAGIDVLDVAGGFCGFSIPGASEQGYFAPLTEDLKQVVSIPVILTGGIKDAEIADRLLREGKADLIGVGRTIMSDSLWAKKAVETLQSR
jgi:2,4-dienoyl-CoA reductase-like NADH-dependent reductase (Old Yellow Enzyme family)